MHEQQLYAHQPHDVKIRWTTSYETRWTKRATNSLSYVLAALDTIRTPVNKQGLMKQKPVQTTALHVKYKLHAFCLCIASVIGSAAAMACAAAHSLQILNFKSRDVKCVLIQACFHIEPGPISATAVFPSNLEKHYRCLQGHDKSAEIM